MLCRVVIVLNMDIVGSSEKIGDPKQYVGDPDGAQSSNGVGQNGSAAYRSAGFSIHRAKPY